MNATLTPKTVTRDQQTRPVWHQQDKTPAKTPARPSLVRILLRALSAFAA